MESGILVIVALWWFQSVMLQLQVCNSFSRASPVKHIDFGKHRAQQLILEDKSVSIARCCAFSHWQLALLQVSIWSGNEDQSTSWYVLQSGDICLACFAVMSVGVLELSFSVFKVQTIHHNVSADFVEHLALILLSEMLLWYMYFFVLQLGRVGGWESCPETQWGQPTETEGITAAACVSGCTIEAGDVAYMHRSNAKNSAEKSWLHASGVCRRLKVWVFRSSRRTCLSFHYLLAVDWPGLS